MTLNGPSKWDVLLVVYMHLCFTGGFCFLKRLALLDLHPLLLSKSYVSKVLPLVHCHVFYVGLFFIVLRIAWSLFFLHILGPAYLFRFSSLPDFLYRGTHGLAH
jgi:hypothetical protein